MGKHSGNPRQEPTTDAGKPWEELTGEEKAAEFEASCEDPGGYAERNFPDEPSGTSWFGGKHK